MERVVFSEEQYFLQIDAMSNKMTRLKKRVVGVVLIAGVFLGMHFLWMYCLPVPKDNLSKSQLFSIRPEMSAEQVISILGRPEFMKVFNQSEHGSKATVFSNDFVRITNSSKKCTWVFSNQDYFQKKLEFYINFVDGSVARVAVERDDLAAYSWESGDFRAYMNNEQLLSFYLNP